MLQHKLLLPWPSCTGKPHHMQPLMHSGCELCDRLAAQLESGLCKACMVSCVIAGRRGMSRSNWR